MRYRKLNIELIVLHDEADAIVGELNATLDRLEETFTLICGGVETGAVEQSVPRKSSALAHAIAAGHTAVKAARNSVTRALHTIT